MTDQQVPRFSFPTARLGVSAAAALAAVLIAGCDAPSTTTASSPSAVADRGDIAWSSTPESSAAAATSTTSRAADVPRLATNALSTLERLPVKGRAPKTGYDRALFGQPWTDDVSVDGGHNGCDTRNDILRRDLTDVTYKTKTRDCVVASGTLRDVYTNKTIAFQRGATTSSAVQIDHVVALSDAWQKGAQQLSTEERTDLANDPRNLQAVDGPTNQRKSDSDAASWLPPNRSYRCTYVARQIDVKASYRLWVTAAEKSAMQQVLSGCGGDAPSTPSAVPEPTTQPQRQEPVTATRAPIVQTPTPAPPAPPAPPAAGADVFYANCAAARAAGAAPILAGQPGYSRKLDRDGDGIACE